MNFSRAIKGMMRVFVDLLLIVFIIPLAFVFTYFFPLFFTGTNLTGLANSIAKLSFHLSWVSAPLLVAVVLALKLMIRRKLKWFAVLLVSYAAGFLWLILWNWIVEDLFSLWRSVIPLSICCFFSMAYVMGKMLYLDDQINFLEQPDPELLNSGRAVAEPSDAEDEAECETQAP